MRFGTIKAYLRLYLTEFWENGTISSTRGFLDSNSFTQEPMSTTEHATPLYSCDGVFIDRAIFGSNFPEIRLPWECHDQSQEINWRHCVTEPELLFFHKRKGLLKVAQSIKVSRHRLSIGVACSRPWGLLSYSDSKIAWAKEFSLHVAKDACHWTEINQRSNFTSKDFFWLHWSSSGNRTSSLSS